MIRGGRNIPLEKSDRKYIYCRTHGPCLWHFPSAEPIYLCAMISSCVFKEKGLSAVHQPNRWRFKHFLGFPGGASDREPACQCRRHKRCGFEPWVREIPWRRARQPSPVFFLENPMERGAWWATVSRVTKNWTWLKQLLVCKPLNVGLICYTVIDC